MSRPRNITTAPTGSIAPLGIRLLPELRDRVNAAARINGRSVNAEVTDRLQKSFDEAPSEKQSPTLTIAVKEAIQDEIAERGGTESEALERLVLKGQVPGGTVFYARISPDTTAKHMRDMLNVTAEIIPDAASVIIVRDTGKSNQN